MPVDARHTYRKERKGRGELKGFFEFPALRCFWSRPECGRDCAKCAQGLAFSAVIFDGGR
jgi:hypothetical protein